MNIRRLRKERSKPWTQQDLADKTQIERTTISKYEKGILIPTAENLKRIEEVLGVPTGSLAQKVAIAIPDTSALMRNQRLLNLLLEDYSQIIIADVVIHELSGLKNTQINRYSSPQERRNRKVASLTLSMIDDYIAKYKGKGHVVRRDTRHFDVSKNLGNSEQDQRIVELAKEVRKQSSRVVDIIHNDKDFPLLADDSVNTLYLEEYMAKRSKADSNYQILLDLDLEFDHLKEFDVMANQLDLNALLPDGMTPLISCIHCNDPEKRDSRTNHRFIPEEKIQQKMKFLLDHGADPNKTDCHQYCHTPLEHCIEKHEDKKNISDDHDPSFEEFCILLDYGADYNKGSVDETQPYVNKRISEINEGNTPLMIACYLGKMKYVKKLCEYDDICVNSQDCNGYTPLIKAAVARWNRKNEGKKHDRYDEIYHYLLNEKHADPLIRDRNNHTAQYWWDRPVETEEDDND